MQMKHKFRVNNAQTHMGFGDAPFVVNETAGRLEFKTSSNSYEFVSASVQPFYDTYEDFSLDIRTKNKDIKVLIMDFLF